MKAITVVGNTKTITILLSKNRLLNPETKTDKNQSILFKTHWNMFGIIFFSMKIKMHYKNGTHKIKNTENT